MSPSRTDPPTAFNRHVITCTGDSLTNNPLLGIYEHEHWPEVLAKSLRVPPTRFLKDGTAISGGQGCQVRARNLGHNGNYSGPLTVASTTIVSSADTTHCVLTSATGFLQWATVIINGQLSLIASISGSTLTLQYPISGMAANQTVLAQSNYGQDTITRFGMVLGAKTPKELELLFQYGTAPWEPPDIGIIFIGANDGAGGVTPHITGLNLNTTIKTAPSNSVATWPQGSSGYTAIPLQTGQGANAVIGQVAVILDPSTGHAWTGLVIGVAGDTIYLSQNTHALDPRVNTWVNWMSGAQNPLESLPPVGASVLQGTQANIQWMMQQLFNAGTEMVMSVGYHYLNYSAGQGDTPGAPYGGGVTLRGFQLAAATAMAANVTGGKAVYSDTYAYMLGLINNGTPFHFGPTLYAPVQGDHAWHVYDVNQHPSALGHAIIGASVLQTMEAQSGWLSALRS